MVGFTGSPELTVRCHTPAERAEVQPKGVFVTNHPRCQSQPELVFPPHLSPSSSSSSLFLHWILVLSVSFGLNIPHVIYIKISYAKLSGTTDRRRWMNHLLMQSMVKAQCLSNGKWAGISKCICISLICAVRGKQLLMKGRCLPLDPTGRWGKMHIESFEELGVMSNLG